MGQPPRDYISWKQLRKGFLFPHEKYFYNLREASHYYNLAEREDDIFSAIEREYRNLVLVLKTGLNLFLSSCGWKVKEAEFTEIMDLADYLDWDQVSFQMGKLAFYVINAFFIGNIWKFDSFSKERIVSVVEREVKAGKLKIDGVRPPVLYILNSPDIRKNVLLVYHQKMLSRVPDWDRLFPNVEKTRLKKYLEEDMRMATIITASLWYTAFIEAGVLSETGDWVWRGTASQIWSSVEPKFKPGYPVKLPPFLFLFGKKE